MSILSSIISKGFPLGHNCLHSIFCACTVYTSKGYVICMPPIGIYSTACLDSYPLGCAAQSEKCLTADAFLTADPGVASLIPTRSNNFVEIGHEIIIRSFSPLPLIKEGLLSV